MKSLGRIADALFAISDGLFAIASVLQGRDEDLTTFREAQKPVNGQVPGPGGLYPAGSQQD